jgi:hypothetical protein
MITEFQTTLSVRDAAWLRHWHNVESSAWDDPDITDRAVGIPLPHAQHQAGALAVAPPCASVGFYVGSHPRLSPRSLNKLVLYG